MPTTITLSGWKEFEQKLATLPAVLMEEVDAEAKYAAEEWATLAKQAAPKDVGFLTGGIDVKAKGKGTYEVVSMAEYSAFMEWGTKTRVQVPADIAEYAAQFRGGGPGQGNAKTMIYAWMERKGIPKQFWWIVFISIVKKGVHPHPFFFIQRPIVEKQLVERVKKILNTEH